MRNLIKCSSSATPETTPILIQRYSIFREESNLKIAELKLEFWNSKLEYKEKSSEIIEISDSQNLYFDDGL